AAASSKLPGRSLGETSDDIEVVGGGLDTLATTRPTARGDRARARKLEEPADHSRGAQPVGVEVVDVADANDRRADAMRVERGLAVVAVGVRGLLVGGGHV